MKGSIEKLLNTSAFNSIEEEKDTIDKESALNDCEKIDINIFQGYDIRGDAIACYKDARVNLRPKDAYLIGLAIGCDFIEKSSSQKEKDYRPKVFIAADNRLSSPSLRKALVEGAFDAGCYVDYTEEEVPTGAVSRKILISDYDISIQITGSHNPYFNNGFKITSRQDKNGFHNASGDPSALYGNKRNRPFELINIYDRIVSKTGLRFLDGGKKRELKGIVDEYIDDFIKYFKKKLKAGKGKFKKSFAVVLDPGNGVGACAEKLFKALGVQTLSIFSKSDGRFPNHPADPSKEDGVKFTCEFVRSLNKTSKIPFIGVVFDGDGDRSGIVNEDGDVIYPEKIVVINYIRFILENLSALQYLEKIGEKVGLALDVRGPSFTEKLIADFAKKKKLGLFGFYIPGGYPSHRTFVKEQIEKIDNIIQTKKPAKKDKDLLEKLKKTYTSAETSGHFFYATAPDNYPDIVIDDGIFSSVNLLCIIDSLNDVEAKEAYLKLKKKRSYLVKDIFDIFKWQPVSNEIRDKAPFEDSEKFAAIDDFKKTAFEIKEKRISNPFSKEISNIIDIDGVRIVFEDNSFLLMRASNTSPKFTYKFEGPTQKRLIMVIEEFIDFLKSSQIKDIGIEEIEKELLFQNSINSPNSSHVIKKDYDIFSFKNFDSFVSLKDYQAFLKSKAFKEHVKLIDKNESSDRFGYRSTKKGTFGSNAESERKEIQKWIVSRIKEGFSGLIHFGIGGQALGNRAQIETMGRIKGLKIKVIEKLGTDIGSVLNEFKKSHIPSHKILLHASSKSGTTDETLIGFQDALHTLCIELAIHFDFGAVVGEEVFDRFRTLLKKGNEGENKILFSKSKLKDLKLDPQGLTLLKELFKRVIFTTSISKEQSRFYAFASSPMIKELMKDSPLAVFTIPNNVGGRFSELCQSGAVTIFFSGRSIQKQFIAGKKLIPLLESHEAEENSALKLAVLSHIIDPEVIIFAYPLFYMKAEAQQKAQLFPESNGKNRKGAFVITAIGNDELNRKVKTILKLNPSKPPLVIIQNTRSLDKSVSKLQLEKSIAKKVPIFEFNRNNLSEENMAACALFFQEFTVRFGILRTAENFIAKKVSVDKLNFNKKDSKEMKTYFDTDPQNQPFVELAKRSVSQRALKMFKNESSAAKDIEDYYKDILSRVKTGPFIERIIIKGDDVELHKHLMNDKALQKMQSSSKKVFSEMENDVLFNAVESIKDIYPENWKGRSSKRDIFCQSVEEKISALLDDISVLGRCPIPDSLEYQAKVLAQVLFQAEKEGKIALPIFYTESIYAEILGLFYNHITGLDFGIGTREQHSFFQSILDGFDKTFTLLFDFSCAWNIIKNRERQIFTFGMAKDYLHNLYPDMVRRLFLEAEADAIKTVKRSACIMRLRGLDDKEAVCQAFRIIARGVYLKNESY